MGFFRGVGRVVKPLVNFPKWMNAKQLSSDASYIASLAKTLVKTEHAEREETFEEALVRLNLSEKDIQARYSEFKRLSIIFFTLFILLLCYFIYLILGISGPVSWRAYLLTLVVMGMALAQFIRFHFWLFQIKQRKLGCSFKAYFLSGLLGFKAGTRS